MSLKQIGHQLERQIQEGIDWMDRSGKMDREKQARFQDSQRKVRKVLRVLEKKPVFALFGASQVGKSYLAHIILSGDEPDLKIDLGGEEPVDFLTKINPTGKNREATGVVTRFTIEPIQHKSHPVLVRFMSMEDICTVLCKAYFENFQGRIPTTREVTIEAIESLRTDIDSIGPSPTLPISQEIRYSLRDLERNLKQTLVDQNAHWENLEAAGFWEMCQNELDRLLTQPDLFARLLAVLWEAHSGVTSIAEELLQSLKSLNWGEEGYLPGNSVLRKNYGGAAIVDAASLEHLGKPEENAEFVEVLMGGQSISLKATVLSALTKEVVLSVQVPNDGIPGYLQQNDIMDFPGARSPDDLTQSTDQIYRPYLRGKVSHLFDQYSRDFEVNNLIFCIPDKDNDGQNKLPRVLNNWILSNVGENAVARQQLIGNRGSSPLMVVLTWFNRQIEFDKKNDHLNSLSEKWSRRFKDFFEDQIVSDNKWAEQWTTEGGFKNIFPLRDYGFSEQTFAGYTSDSPKETGYAPIKKPNKDFKSAEDFQAALKESFIASEWCNKYLEDPEATWDACAMPNRDGSAPIIQAMERASSSAAIEVHAKSVLRDAKTKALDELSRHYHDDDIAAQHAQAERLSAELNLALNALAAIEPGAIVALQSALKLSAEDVTEWLNSQVVTSTGTDTEALERFLLFHPFLTESMTPAQCLEAFRSHYRMADSESAIESGWNVWGVDLKNLFPSENEASRSSPLIEQALEHFRGRCLVFDEERHGHLTVGALSSDVLRSMFEELVQGMKTRRIAERISEFVAGQPELSVMGQIDAPRLGALIAHQWNEFMFFADDSYYTESELEKVRFTASDRVQNALKAYDALTSSFGAQPLSRLPQVHQQPGIDLIAGWLQRLSNLFIVNCGFANYDPAENEALSRILIELKAIEI